MLRERRLVSKATCSSIHMKCPEEANATEKIEGPSMVANTRHHKEADRCGFEARWDQVSMRPQLKNKWKAKDWGCGSVTECY
jgi:hypothetical protein